MLPTAPAAAAPASVASSYVPPQIDGVEGEVQPTIYVPEPKPRDEASPVWPQVVLALLVLLVVAFASYLLNVGVVLFWLPLFLLPFVPVFLLTWLLPRFGTDLSVRDICRAYAVGAVVFVPIVLWETAMEQILLPYLSGSRSGTLGTNTISPPNPEARSVFAAIFVMFIAAFAIASLVEESAKLVIGYFFVSPRVTSARSLVVLTVAAATSFSCIEDLMYMMRQPTATSLVLIGVVRGLLPLHEISAFLIGIALVRIRYFSETASVELFAVPYLFHGLYDFLVFLVPLAVWGTIVGLVLILPLFAFALFYAWTMYKRYLAVDSHQPPWGFLSPEEAQAVPRTPPAQV
jgi:hypothetical protein